MAKKEKKISFQVFLRKSERGYTEGFYKVYLRINFNGESNKLSEVLFDGRSLFWTEDDLERWNKGDYKGSYKGEAIHLLKSLEFYENIIRVEYNKSPDTFTLKGFSKLILFYQRNILKLIKEKIYYQFAIAAENLEYVFLMSELAKGQGFVEAAVLNKKKIDDTTKLMISFYVLVYLYSSPNFNFKFDHYLGNTAYDFLIKDGCHKFYKFVDDFLNKDENSLDFDYLEGQMATSPIIQKELLPLLQVFEPKIEEKDKYKYFFKEHVSLFDE